MKTKILLSTIAMLGLASFAEARLNPETFCEDFACSLQMQAVVRDYTENPNPPQVAQAPWLVSGECWHLAPVYRADQTHHAMFLMENTIRGPWARGLFSFFAPQDPFASETVESARDRLNASSGPGQMMIIRDRHADWNFAGETSMLAYWVRVNEEKGEAYLISRWMFWNTKSQDHLAFCRLKRHTN
jgi:hypothetical protein